MDERMCRLAASVFTDVHHGSAITESEFEYDKKLSEAYEQEIKEAKKIIATDSNFNNLSYQEKIVYVLELLNRLRIKNHGNEEIITEISNGSKDNYADINDLLNSIPQEPYEEIFKKR